MPRDTRSGSEENGSREDHTRIHFEDPAPEAMKDPADRDLETLRQQLRERGWDQAVNDWTKDRLFYTDEHAKDGTYGLEFRYPEGENMGFVLQHRIHREEAWAQYWLKFEADFDCNDQDYADHASDGGKLPGWDGRYGECEPRFGPYDGTLCWSAHGSFHDPGRWGGPEHVDGGPVQLCYYVYHADLEKEFGETVPWKMNDDAGVVDPGEWYEVTCHAKMNTPGENDGVLEGWVDGTKAYERRDFRFRAAGHEELKIRTWWHGSHFGGGWHSPRDNSMYTDDVRLYHANPL